MKAYRSIRHSGVQVIQTEPNEAVVLELYVDPDDRGHGVGRRLMAATCKDADREDVTLYLTPNPYGSYDIVEEKYYPPGLSYKELCKFYRTFGFRFKSKEEIMIRKPRRY